ncbi:hypothetical protein SAMN05421636_102344 [Pricia antarctica]|uniref:Dolichyl-phosphate-mannose-protein mannosyltransferase n=1 Tax=Pricia antarctica TaxID=641691 RepID=A0A1G6YR34_9FLAO|nr:hypothetical protein [Pricia antarctica]SDD92762.1 hypothetical protein SAMN05421636_102344 [Pricia antarctica]
MKNRSLILLPLLALYWMLIVLYDSSLKGDEFRYLRYANNLIQGFYTDPNNPDLSNGPGYPLILLPFVALKIPLLVPKLLNGIFIFIGVFYFHKTLQFYTKQKYALIFACIIGLYPPFLRWMIYLYSESFSFMLMSVFIFHFCYLFQRNKQKWKSCILASFFLGFLVLTKVIFFHVVVLSAVLLFILFLSKIRKSATWASLVLIGAFVFILPYIAYAYSVTGKLFYLGTRGGEILYHRSTPFENESGNWFSSNSILGQEIENDHSEDVYQNLSNLRTNHREFYLQLESLSNMERDSAFKAKAFQNMKEYPLKYCKNTLANVGRFIFNYPISYRSQNLNAYGYIIPNMFIVVLFIVILYPALLSIKKIPFELKAILVFAIIYGFGMILLGGKGRYFTMMVPALALFLAYGYTNILKITLVKR